MTWVKLDDQFPDNPKIVKVGPLGGWLQVCGLAYCNRHLTDGFIPTDVAHRLTSFVGVDLLSETGLYEHAPTCEHIAALLCAEKIWKKVTGGYRIHDYGEYQPSRADVLAEREKTRKRVEKFRKGNAASNAVTNAERNAVSNAAPVPVPVQVEETPKGVSSSTTTRSYETDAAAPARNGRAAELSDDIPLPAITAPPSFPCPHCDHVEPTWSGYTLHLTLDHPEVPA
jgi:hypothetical protein